MGMENPPWTVICRIWCSRNIGKTNKSGRTAFRSVHSNLKSKKMGSKVIGGWSIHRTYRNYNSREGGKIRKLFFLYNFYCCSIPIQAKFRGNSPYCEITTCIGVRVTKMFQFTLLCRILSHVTLPLREIFLQLFLFLEIFFRRTRLFYRIVLGILH